MDWDDYEHEDPRDRRRRVDRVPRPWMSFKEPVLRYLYPVPGPYGPSHRSRYLIPSIVASAFSVDLGTIRMVLASLAEDGFVRGPVDLPKFDEKGKPISYAIRSIGKLSALYPEHVRTEWDGQRWVSVIDSFGINRTKSGSYRYSFKLASKKTIRRRLRKAKNARRPVDFDGRGFEILEDGDAYLRYGEANGLFEYKKPEERSPNPGPEPEICPRCGGVVEYKTRRGKRVHKDHGLRKCNANLVSRIMEE